MRHRFCWWKAVLLAGAASLAWGGTFGKVVSIGGHASDLALDEARGVLYVANFTANRIEVMSLADLSIQTSMNVAPQPGSVALSPDGRYLVVAHFGNFQAPNTSRNALTVIDLNGGGKQTFALGSPPLGVAFGLNNLALVVTTQEFVLFDPVSGTTQLIDTVSGVTAKTLPQPPANFPAQIIAASLGVSGDGLKIYGLTDTMEFGFDVISRQLRVINYTSSPAMGPRVVSVSQDGSYFLGGWALNDRRGTLLAQFPNPKGLLNVGSHAIDSARGLVYAQIPQAVVTVAAPASPAPATPAPQQGIPTSAVSQTEAPMLQICEADNLAVRERLQLPENLAGKSLLSSDGSVMYAVSDSGVTVLPMGSLNSVRRVVASQEDLVFRGGYCDRRVAAQEVTILDPSGASVEFTISSTLAGVSVSPSSGVTPANVRISVDPSAFQNQSGTAIGYLKIQSATAVNLPSQVRVLVNLHEPDQRGSMFSVPGKLVDILADPTRDRFFVLRQDKNQVLVYDGATYSQIATLRTGNTPMHMAFTFDRRYLVVANDNSQIANVFDMETLEASVPIRFPGGHYARSIASSGKAMLAATRVAGPKNTIDRIDFNARTATELPTLGIYDNSINLNTALVASPNGSSILVAQADGNVLLYNANADTFTVSRKDFAALAGAYAASSFDQYVVGNTLLNSSLVAVKQFETGTGSPSGFAFVDQSGLRTTALSASAPGVIQRVDAASGAGQRATRMVEAPVLPETGAAFTRTLAPLYSRNAILNLTTSGFTALAWNYDASVAPPRVERVVNAADLTAPVAPGSLITIFGRDLSVTNLASKEMPLPTALGESCLTVNGVAIPMLFVSPTQINAQLPFQTDGNVTLILRTPGGVSDNFNMIILPTAPSIFRNGVVGTESAIPTVVRVTNGQLVTLSNPVHRGDTLIIYLTGMGRTSPAVDAGLPAPGDPPVSVLISPEVSIGGIAMPVTFAGLSPGQIGVYQINVRVTDLAPTGLSQPLTITQGGGSTTLEVRVVD